MVKAHKKHYIFKKKKLFPIGFNPRKKFSNLIFFRPFQENNTSQLHVPKESKKIVHSLTARSLPVLVRQKLENGAANIKNGN